MKRKLLSALLILAMVFTSLTALVGCVSLEEGTKWFYGTEAPGLDILAKNGDMYLDTDDGIVYTLTDEGWVCLGSYNGSDGQDGNPGQDGEDGEDGQDGITPLLRIDNGVLFVSYDNGASWDVDYDIYVNGVSLDLGYPSTIELPDGSFLTVFYAHRSKEEPAIVMQQKWRFEE